jgi:hypothetical protein
MAVRITDAVIRRSFRVTVELTPEYGPPDVPHPIDAVVKVVRAWQDTRREDNYHYLDGVVSAGTAVYGRPGGRGQEPVAVFAGEVAAADWGDFGDVDVVKALNELAEVFVHALDQRRVYVVFRDEQWVIEKV